MTLTALVHSYARAPGALIPRLGGRKKKGIVRALDAGKIRPELAGRKIVFTPILACPKRPHYAFFFPAEGSA